MHGETRSRTCGAAVVHHELLESRAYQAARTEIDAFRSQFDPTARVGITTIPVVVHVVYNTNGENVSDAQVQSQIAVLNADFRAANPDRLNTPAVWHPRIADARIEFALATVAPDGSPTSGIVRVATQVASFAKAGNPVKSAAAGGADPWPSDRYLNIWVCTLRKYLGYAQFPGGPATTDGVVILNTAFGTTGTAAAPFNLGRTTTHEVGHWLDLFHIWGDNLDCTGDDYVSDTPVAGAPNYNKPAFPRLSCNNAPDGDMFMNYMDYVDDDTMCMFTAGQVVRMQAALDGPRSAIGGTLSAAERAPLMFESYPALWE